MIAASRREPDGDTDRLAVRLLGIRKAYGGTLALQDACLELANGEVHALLGENGAGKSTLMNILAGFTLPDGGIMEVAGQHAAWSGPRDAAAHGIGMVHQHFKLVGPLSVLDNIWLSCARTCGWRRRPEAEAAWREISATLGIRVAANRRVDQLSVSDQQKIEIGKVLLIGARTLIMDEPTAVLTDGEAIAMLEGLRRLAREGRGVILITHKLRDVLGFADRVTIMRNGRTVLAGAPVGSLGAAEMAEAMVGEALVLPMRPTQAPGPPRLTMERVCTEGTRSDIALKDICLRIRGGEILGIAGIGGNGQAELAETLIGVRSPLSGRVMLDDRPVPPVPALRRGRGLRFVPADRFRLGLFGDLSLMENIVIPRLAEKHPGRRFWVPPGWMRELATDAIDAFEVAGAAPGTAVRLLSGGNAQKLMLAREFAGSFSVLVAHSPTRGLDVKAVAAVRQRLIAAAQAGAAVLLISEDLDEVLEMSDRVAVMSHGRLSAASPVEQASRAELGRMMLELA